MAKEKVPEKIRLDKDSFDIIYNAIRDVYEYNQAYRPANYLFQGDVLTYKEKANQWKGREQELKKNNGQGFKQLGDFDEALQWYVHTAVTCQYTDQDKLRELQDMAVSITQDGVYGFILTLFQKKIFRSSCWQRTGHEFSDGTNLVDAATLGTAEQTVYLYHEGPRILHE